MKIILIGDELERSHNIDFELKWLWFAAAFCGFFVLSFLFSIYLVLDRGARVSAVQRQLDDLHQQILFEQSELNQFYTYSDAVFVEHAKKAGLMQARVARLEALGGRLADMANFSSEFDFYSDPAIGGPENADLLLNAQESPAMNILHDYEKLAEKLRLREQELLALDSLLSSEQLQKEQYVAGKPVQKGWLSSPFGKRIDPFHGRVRWHKGVDYAGKMGSNILAVASGVVVWSGDRYGYGDMVEINHGNGYITRYAHNSKNHVQIGEIVNKGQAIAAMGTSGRSTGPHVHFEVIKNGKAVNPERYIYRKTI
ncbi:MAG: M23 family metallopeptidase [Pseudomonadales bacterium]|nr:M23 family metallopeptidase [Pseudomonadales bacterium]